MINDINFTPKVNPENKYTNAQMTEKYIYILFFPQGWWTIKYQIMQVSISDNIFEFWLVMLEEYFSLYEIPASLLSYLLDT